MAKENQVYTNEANGKEFISKEYALDVLHDYYQLYIRIMKDIEENCISGSYSYDNAKSKIDRYFHRMSGRLDMLHMINVVSPDEFRVINEEIMYLKRHCHKTALTYCNF